MTSIKGLEATFDTVVANYDKMRPGYVPELYKAIFEYVSIGENSKAIEVGSGSGQATFPVLKTGCELISVEYGENFSKIFVKHYLNILLNGIILSKITVILNAR